MPTEDVEVFRCYCRNRPHRITLIIDHRLSLVFFYLTTIGVLSAVPVGAIENTSQVFQPEDRF